MIYTSNIVGLRDRAIIELMRYTFANDHKLDQAEALAALVNGTPFIESFSFEEIAKVIEAELAK